jgi:CRP-like cAMP-binding protein
MAVKGLHDIIISHPLFAGLAPDFLDLVEACARNVRVKAGTYLMHEDDSADEIFLLREGQVALEIAAPGAGHRAFQVIGPGGLIGLSWLVPPYRWAFDARARTPLRAISIDAACLRHKCDRDPALGYEVMQRFTPVIVERLHDTRLQMLDIYGPHS